MAPQTEAKTRVMREGKDRDPQCAQSHARPLLEPFRLHHPGIVDLGRPGTVSHLSPFPAGRSHFLLGIDANAHFDSAELPWIGDHGAELRRNFAAEKFCRFLAAFNLFLPATFHAFHRGQTGTWRRCAHAELARCDYVAIPIEWKCQQIVSEILPTLDPGTVVLDHIAVGVWIMLSYIATQKPWVPQYDREGIRSITQDQIQHLVQSIPDVPWTENVHTHAQTLTDTISRWLSDHFPPKKRTPRRSYIGQEAWDVRSKRAGLRRLLVTSKSSFGTYDLTIAWTAWKTRSSLYRKSMTKHGKPCGSYMYAAANWGSNFIARKKSSGDFYERIETNTSNKLRMKLPVDHLENSMPSSEWLVLRGKSTREIYNHYRDSWMNKVR